MSWVHTLTNMHHYGPGWELYWEREYQDADDPHGDIVVRVRPKGSLQDYGQSLPAGHEVCRLGWPNHVHRPAEPLHENIVQMIAEALVVALRDAHLLGRRSAMADVRQLIGAEAVGPRRW